MNRHNVFNYQNYFPLKNYKLLKEASRISIYLLKKRFKKMDLVILTEDYIFSKEN